MLGTRYINVFEACIWVTYASQVTTSTVVTSQNQRTITTSRMWTRVSRTAMQHKLYCDDCVIWNLPRQKHSANLGVSNINTHTFQLHLLHQTDVFTSVSIRWITISVHGRCSWGLIRTCVQQELVINRRIDSASSQQKDNSQFTFEWFE